MTDEEEDEITTRREEAPERRARSARRSRRCPIRRRCWRACTRRPKTSTRRTTSSAMAELTYLQAISDGLRTEMRRDERVFVIGEDVGVYGGAFKVTLGFQEEFGPWRVIDAPLAETAIVGGATGAAMMGMRPVAEMQFADFVSCAWDHLVTIAAKQRWRVGTPVPIVAAAPVGRRLLAAARSTRRTPSRRSRTSRASSACARRRRRMRRACSSARSRIRTPCSTSSTSTSTAASRREVPEERYTTPIGKARTHKRRHRRLGDHLGRDGLHRRGGRAAARRRRRLGRDHRPAHGHAVGQGGGARVGAQDLEGARAPRGHAHRRLRRARSRRRSPRRRSRISTRR